MKFASLACLLLLATAAFALPKSVEEFKTRQATESLTAQGAAHLFFDAALVYMGGDVQLGTQLLTLAVKDAAVLPCLLDTLRLRPHILRSYVRGATPENGYTLNPEAYELNLKDLSFQPLPQFPVGKVVRLMLQSGGADTPRALDLERDGLGLYRVRNAAPLCLGVKTPLK